jgi:hypothetical protein
VFIYWTEGEAVVTILRHCFCTILEGLRKAMNFLRIVGVPAETDVCVPVVSLLIYELKAVGMGFHFTVSLSPPHCVQKILSSLVYAVLKATFLTCKTLLLISVPVFGLRNIEFTVQIITQYCYYLRVA